MTRNFLHRIYELNASQIQDMRHIPIVVHFDPTSLNYSSIASEKVTFGYNKTSRVSSLKNVTMPWQFYIAWKPTYIPSGKKDVVGHHKRWSKKHLMTICRLRARFHVSPVPVKQNKLCRYRQSCGWYLWASCWLVVGWALVVECVSIL